MSFIKFSFILFMYLWANCSAFDYGKTPIRGVNLGSWLVLEKWMTPSVFAGLNDSVVDEYTLCQALGYTAAQKKLKAHWESWVTENDIVQLKAAGVNHLRIPVGYWAFETLKGDPYVSGSWDYAMKAVGWAKKYGIQVMIDLHGAPGSQNGQDNSGRKGPIEFYYNDTNLAIAARIVGKIAKIVNTTEWKSTVSIIEVLNEPKLWGSDYQYRLTRLKQYYSQAYEAVRAVNKDVIVAVHDAFISHDNWYYLGPGSNYTKMMLDAHYYQVFNADLKNLTCAQQTNVSCQYYDSLPKDTQKLLTVVGEWSLATPTNCRSTGTVATLAQQQIGVYERGSGWMFWNFKMEGGADEWSFLASVKKGWINLANKNVAKC